jgi:hypothetical protein
MGIQELPGHTEVVMPIRITCRDKPLYRVQLIEYKGVNTPLPSDLMACYTDRKTPFRILCGSTGPLRGRSSAATLDVLSVLNQNWR